MTTLTFDQFSSTPRHHRCGAGPAPAPLPAAASVPLRRAQAAAARQQRRRGATRALVGVIAALHGAAIVTLAGAPRTAAAPPKPIAISIALAPPRITPPPPPRATQPPPRAQAPGRAPAAAAPPRAPQATPVAAASTTSAFNEPAAIAAPAPAVATTAPVAAAAAPAGVVDDKVSEPRGYAGYLHNPAPAYPPAAQRRGLEGQVVLKVHVLASGQPDNITVAKSSGHAILDDAAIKAVTLWAFAPARRGPAAVDGWVQVPLTFKI
jgi:protein TonB